MSLPAAAARPPARPRSVGRFPGPESSCNVDDGGGGGGARARGQLNERLFKWPDLATGNGAVKFRLLILIERCSNWF